MRTFFGITISLLIKTCIRRFDVHIFFNSVYNICIQQNSLQHLQTVILTAAQLVEPQHKKNVHLSIIFTSVLVVGWCRQSCANLPLAIQCLFRPSFAVTTPLDKRWQWQKTHLTMRPCGYFWTVSEVKEENAQRSSPCWCCWCLV